LDRLALEPDSIVDESVANGIDYLKEINTARIRVTRGAVTP
jgi:hypothetical protein